MKRSLTALALFSACALAPAALADFNSQTILGPLTNGSSVSNTNVGKADDNDGFTSGMHIFDIWNGGDDAYRLDWDGGPMSVILNYDSFFCDVDLFVYRGNVDDSGDYSIMGTSPDIVNINNAPVGTYYIVVDSVAGTEGAYRLDVVPAPGAAGLLGTAALFAARRRRR
jgi:hypothetical protein